MNPDRYRWLAWALMFIVLVLFAGHAWRPVPQTTEVSYTEFLNALQDDRFIRITVDGERLVGELRRPQSNTRALRTVMVEPAVWETIQGDDVDVRAQPTGGVWQSVVSMIVPTVVFFALWWWVMQYWMTREGVGNMAAFSRRDGRLHFEADTGVRFVDVAGVDEAKEELQEWVEFLRNPPAWRRLGAHIPRGVLLVGPPGTGKTLLARAVAGEAGVPFFALSGSEFIELFVGVGAARVRELFAEARRHAPAIIFIDELDALGRMRGVSWSGGHDEREQTLNQLLAEMDGFDPAVGVILLAATNRPEILDPALLRAGRFDRHVSVDLPDRVGRRHILAVHLKPITVAHDVPIETLAAMTTGFSGAELATWVNEAALIATRHGAQAVTLADFMAAFERRVAGLEKRHSPLAEGERRVVAFHELGHAWVGHRLRPDDPVQKVSIIPRAASALGFTWQRPATDRHMASRRELLAQLAILLAGRAAERVFVGDVTTGAADDLARATALATRMVSEFGMDSAVGLVSTPPAVTGPLWMEASRVPAWLDTEMARRSMEAVRTLLEDALSVAEGILRHDAERIQAGVTLLLERETLLESDLCGLWGPLTPLPPGAVP